MLKFVKTKEELPTYTDLECPICYKIIDLDANKDGVPDCVICANGHRVHNSCFRQMTNHECPVCRNKEMRFCSSLLGYSYFPRKGGKVKKTKKSFKKKKSCKRRKTCRRKSNK